MTGDDEYGHAVRIVELAVQVFGAKDVIEDPEKYLVKAATLVEKAQDARDRAKGESLRRSARSVDESERKIAWDEAHRRVSDAWPKPLKQKRSFEQLVVRYFTSLATNKNTVRDTVQDRKNRGFDEFEVGGLIEYRKREKREHGRKGGVAKAARGRGDS